jgi:hypothetical protein
VSAPEEWNGDVFVSLAAAKKAHEILGGFDYDEKSWQAAEFILRQALDREFVEQGIAYAAALGDVYLAAGLLFYRRDSQIEDRARLDAAMKRVRAFVFSPAMPWEGRSKESPDIPHGEGDPR